MKFPNCCAVIVSYNSSGDILQNIRILCGQVDAVIAIDNGSSDERLSVLRDIKDPKFELIENGGNLGLAAALNLGIRSARARGFQWVALFDQDSTVDTDYFRSVWSTVALANDVQLGLISPRYMDRTSGRTMIPWTDKNGDPLITMTSGTVIPGRIFDLCGYFDEDLFTDYVDIEFSLRIRSRGYKIVQCEEAMLVHSLGSIKFYRVLGWTFQATHHSAIRRYYITRNRFHLYRHYCLRDPRWFWIDFKSAIKETIKIVVVEQDRIQKLQNVAHGIHDAWLGRMGKTKEL
jgi:rhamnosyltransferase